MTAQKPLYLLANNGECVCAEHLPLYGYRSANARDSQGHIPHKMTDADRAYVSKAIGREIDCEQCRGLG